MRLGQIRFDHKLTAAVFEGEQARPVPDYTIVELIRKAETESIPLTELVMDMASRHCVMAPSAIPLNPVEVWGCDCASQPGAPAPEQARPEIFFKGTARVCVGPGQPVGIRFDSRFTVPEPEFGVVLGRHGKIVGYTLGNDVSAWDLERENPLYLPQSKIYTGSCALGPLIVTPDELTSVSRLEMTCAIERGGHPRFSAGVSLAALERGLDGLIGYLLRANPVPAGSVLLTGTGIVIGEEAALAPGDIVTIRVPKIGELTNPAATVQ